MDSRDGQVFVKVTRTLISLRKRSAESPLQNLAQFVRTHEKALANALQLRRPPPRSAQPKGDVNDASPTYLNAAQGSTPHYSTASAIAAALSLGGLSFSSPNIKSTKLTLTSHHLYYLLAQIEELGIHIGPMDVRLENIHANVSPANYVSFLSQAHRSKRIPRSEHDSIHSASSVRSIMSGMSTLWLGFGVGSSHTIAKTEKARAQFLTDLKYLYSAFTKIPCLRLSLDHKSRPIEGYEEFPFDTAVPLLAFKNLSFLEISDVDFRQFFGWDKLADQLRSLSVRRANLDDPFALLISIVLDDMDRRRRRSSKNQFSPVVPWPTSPSLRFGDLGRANSTPSSPKVEGSYGHNTSPKNGLVQQRSSDTSVPIHHARAKSISPCRPGTTSRLDGLHRPTRTCTPKVQRSGSGSSNSSVNSNEPFRSGSSSNLLSMGILPASKWRFLRHLSIADNSLTSLAASSLVPVANTLHSLDISSNLFTEMPDGLASLVALRALNVSHCMIESLHSLTRYPIPAITALNLRANRLISLAGVERLKFLERLDLRENKMQDPTELARLTGMPHIQEIWVMRNPFVKSHSNYRLTIFNLFRNTPRHAGDVLLDASGPGYSEKRQLREQLPKAETRTIIEPVPDEEPSGRDLVLKLQSESHSKINLIASDQKLKRPSPHETQSEIVVGSSHRTKGPRRRIVDLARDDSPTVLNQLRWGEELREDSSQISAQEQSPNSKPAPLTPFQDKADSTSLEFTPSEVSSALEPTIEVSSRGHSLANEIQSQNLNGEVYRQKVEALKDEVGSNWLSVLSAHGWTGHIATDSHQTPLGHSALPRADTSPLSIVNGHPALG